MRCVSRDRPHTRRPARGVIEGLCRRTAHVAAAQGWSRRLRSCVETVQTRDAGGRCATRTLVCAISPPTSIRRPLPFSRCRGRRRLCDEEHEVADQQATARHNPIASSRIRVKPWARTGVDGEEAVALTGNSEELRSWPKLGEPPKPQITPRLSAMTPILKVDGCFLYLVIPSLNSG